MEIRVFLYPSKKVAEVRQGSRRKGKLLKRYSFKQDIPYVIKTRIEKRHDYNEWCVSERDFEQEITYKEYCETTKSNLKEKIIKYFISNQMEIINTFIVKSAGYKVLYQCRQGWFIQNENGLEKIDKERAEKLIERPSDEKNL